MKLTSAEISATWQSYLNISVVVCLMTHFIETCEDPEILEVLKETERYARKHTVTFEELFRAEGIAVPLGFKPENHVNQDAPKLFSDLFFIQSALQMAKFGLTSHTASLTLSSREDMRILYKGYVDDVNHLYNNIVSLMQKKGVFIPAPYMNYPTNYPVIEKEKFMRGWLGRRRSLLGIEVTNLIENAHHNEIGRDICTGFSQVAKEKEIREFILRGKKMSTQMLGSIIELLEESNVPVSFLWDKGVTDSTIAPFSDQLMMYATGMLSNIGIAAYALGISSSMRRDIGAMYSDFIGRTAAYGEDGMEMMIEKKWLEEPPQF